MLLPGCQNEDTSESATLNGAVIYWPIDLNLPTSKRDWILEANFFQQRILVHDESGKKVIKEISVKQILGNCGSFEEKLKPGTYLIEMKPDKYKLYMYAKWRVPFL